MFNLPEPDDDHGYSETVLRSSTLSINLSKLNYNIVNGEKYYSVSDLITYFKNEQVKDMVNIRP